MTILCQSRDTEYHHRKLTSMTSLTIHHQGRATRNWKSRKNRTSLTCRSNHHYVASRDEKRGTSLTGRPSLLHPAW